VSKEEFCGYLTEICEGKQVITYVEEEEQEASEESEQSENSDEEVCLMAALFVR
jgi:hypothetical protein